MRAKVAVFLPIVLGAAGFLSVRVCQAQTQHQVVLNETLHIQDEVSTEVWRWQEASGARVTDDARKLVQEGFSAESERMQEYLDRQELDAAKSPGFVDRIVDHYLYDLRDRKVSAAATDDPPMSGQRLNLLPEDRISPVIIGKPEVEQFSPRSFLQGIGNVLDSKVGYLDVLSEPDLAGITIDGEKKSKLTCRTFVVSPGDHSVSVFKPRTSVNCSEKVTIAAEATEQVSCPKKEKMKCRVPTNK